MILVFKLFLISGMLMALKEDADEYVEYLRNEARKR